MKKLLIIIGLFSIISSTSGQSKKVDKDILQTELSLFWQPRTLSAGLGLGLNLKYFVAPQHSLGLEFNYIFDADTYCDCYFTRDSNNLSPLGYPSSEYHQFYYHYSSLKYALSYRIHFGDRSRNVVHRLNSLGIFFGFEHLHYLRSSYVNPYDKSVPAFEPQSKLIASPIIYNLYLGIGYNRSFYINKRWGINIGFDWRITYWSSLASQLDSYSYQKVHTTLYRRYGRFDIKIRLGVFFRVPDKKYKIYY